MPLRLLFSCLLLGVLLSAPERAGASSRIISLDLCSDWMLIRYPPAGAEVLYSPLLYRYRVDWVPEGLPTHDGRLESLLPLLPARILSGEFNALSLRQRLEQLGHAVTVLPLPRSLEGIGDYLRRYEAAVGLPAGQLSVAAHPPEPDSGRRLLLLGANGIGTGAGTLEDELLRRAGWRNWLQAPGFQPLDLERLLSDPPDAILAFRSPAPALAGLFAAMPPIRQRMDAQPPFPGGEDDWRWHCPGPWTGALVDDLARWREAMP